MSNPESPMLNIPILLWARLIPDLRRRGAGHRESGAFLLARRSGNQSRIAAYACYDDLDPNALQHGGIAFHDVGYAALWKLCREKGLTVVADVHTHPRSGVGQSPIDRRNPMMPTTGHVALIVPHYAQQGRWSLKRVGTYEYLGNFKWRSYALNERIKLTVW